MILFRKQKVKNLLLQYQKEFQREIPTNSIAYEELLAYKELNLEEIAATYDALEGYKYFIESLVGIEINVRNYIPGKSRCFPSVVPVVRHSKFYIANKVKKLRMLQFIKKGDFYSYPDVSHREYTLVKDNGKCWK